MSSLPPKLEACLPQQGKYENRPSDDDYYGGVMAGAEALWAELLKSAPEFDEVAVYEYAKEAFGLDELDAAIETARWQHDAMAASVAAYLTAWAQIGESDSRKIAELQAEVAAYKQVAEEAQKRYADVAAQLTTAYEDIKKLGTLNIEDQKQAAAELEDRNDKYGRMVWAYDKKCEELQAEVERLKSALHDEG